MKLSSRENLLILPIVFVMAIFISSWKGKDLTENSGLTAKFASAKSQAKIANTSDTSLIRNKITNDITNKRVENKLSNSIKNTIVILSDSLRINNRKETD